jgi:hypothetical protein
MPQTLTIVELCQVVTAAKVLAHTVVDFCTVET